MEKKILKKITKPNFFFKKKTPNDEIRKQNKPKKECQLTLTF
jgi:hypothetical protein